MRAVLNIRQSIMLHLYIAKPALANFYQKLDPTNSFNVGIGHTSKLKYWGKAKS